MIAVCDCRLHNGDNAEIKKYFISFWNGVDLRYKLLKGPKVRISIAGIIISRVSPVADVLDEHTEGLCVLRNIFMEKQKGTRRDAVL